MIVNEEFLGLTLLIVQKKMSLWALGNLNKNFSQLFDILLTK